MSDPGEKLDVFRDIFGVDFTPERLELNLAAFADILIEINKLRELDMADVHPGVIFDPTAGYGQAAGE